MSVRWNSWKHPAGTRLYWLMQIHLISFVTNSSLNEPSTTDQFYNRRRTDKTQSFSLSRQSLYKSQWNEMGLSLARLKGSHWIKTGIISEGRRHGPIANRVALYSTDQHRRSECRQLALEHWTFESVYVEWLSWSWSKQDVVVIPNNKKTTNVFFLSRSFEGNNQYPS